MSAVTTRRTTEAQVGRVWALATDTPASPRTLSGVDSVPQGMVAGVLAEVAAPVASRSISRALSRALSRDPDDLAAPAERS